MNYDVWGSWSPTVGPNAPLDDSCSAVQAGSATSALKAWAGAGFPAAQVRVSIRLLTARLTELKWSACYRLSSGFLPMDTASLLKIVSHSMARTTSLSIPPFIASKQPLGDSDVPGAGNCAFSF